MSGIKSSPEDYISHDVRNRVNVVTGYAEISDLDGKSFEEQLNAAQEFEEAYQRFERVLAETGRFDQSLMEQMRSAGPFYDDIVDRNAASTVYSIESVISIIDPEDEQESIDSILDPISDYGEVNYLDDVAEVQIDDEYSAIISTKICDFQKHVRSENPQAEMFAEVEKDQEGLQILIGDTGSGIDSGDLSEEGKGTEIINEVLDGRDAEFNVYDNNEKENVEGPESYPEQKVGALFELNLTGASI
jgi:hypothetical protein